MWKEYDFDRPMIDHHPSRIPNEEIQSVLTIFIIEASHRCRMQINADLHIHSRFSMATSPSMTISKLAEGASQKGVHLIGSGDCLHPKWLHEVCQGENVSQGTYEQQGIRFVLTTEVEDFHRVHHLILFPSRSAAVSFRESVQGKSKNLDSDGRPNLNMGGEDIAQLALDVDALIGPAHAFTPWTSIFGYHNSLSSCYGDLFDRLSFVELGLSADTDLADRIGELSELTFLTNSDAHSHYPDRLAREFNSIEVQEPTFQELQKAIRREGGRRFVMNVGMPPQEGKYHESACISCYTHYTLRESLMRKWKCTCGKRIKKGVTDRIEELATKPKSDHPSHRPPYLYLIPLAQIITMVYGCSSPNVKKVSRAWTALVNKFGNEVDVLLKTEIADIASTTDGQIAAGIAAFREEKVRIVPGGGGKYGRLELPGPDEGTNQEAKRKDSQQSIFEY